MAALKSTPYAPGLDLGALTEIAEHFAQIRKKYAEFDVSANMVDTNVYSTRFPGMISNFISQLAQQKALDKLPEFWKKYPG